VTDLSLDGFLTADSVRKLHAMLARLSADACTPKFSKLDSAECTVDAAARRDPAGQRFLIALLDSPAAAATRPT
jgi:hypothetical protein